MMFGNRCCCNRQGFGFNQNMNFQPENQVIEPIITKCVEQEFYHEVPHVCPIHTHTVNKHIYKHTYTPQFSCSEECQVVNMDCGKCSGFVG